MSSEMETKCSDETQDGSDDHETRDNAIPEKQMFLLLFYEINKV